MRTAYRSSRDRLLAGVAGGLAEHLAIPVNYVRIGFIAACLLNGLGALLYIGLWLTLPLSPDAESSPSEHRAWWRDSSTLLAAIVLLIGVVGLLGAFDVGNISSAGFGIALAGIGALADLVQRVQRLGGHGQAGHLLAPGPQPGVAHQHQVGIDRKSVV